MFFNILLLVYSTLVVVFLTSGSVVGMVYGLNKKDFVVAVCSIGVFAVSVPFWDRVIDTAKLLIG